MNPLTLFHRATDAEYPPPCDLASVPVLDENDQPAGFIGASWGEWPDPPDCLHWQITTPDGVDDCLAAWGLHRAPPDPTPFLVPTDGVEA